MLRGFDMIQKTNIPHCHGPSSNFLEWVFFLFVLTFKFYPDPSKYPKPRWSIRTESCDAHTGWNWDPKWVRKRPHGVSLKHWELLEVLPRLSKTPEKHLDMWLLKSPQYCGSAHHLISTHAWSIVQNFRVNEHTWPEKQKLLWMQITGAANIRILGVAITFKRIGRTRETALWPRATASNPDVVLNEKENKISNIILYICLCLIR